MIEINFEINYLTHNEDYYVLDIETNPIPATVIWCAVLRNIVSDEVQIFLSVADFKEWHEANPNSVFVGHNAISFDAPVLNDLGGCSISLDRIVDTLVLSFLYHPTMPGGHSLAEWGRRLKVPKYDFHDFDKFSQTMVDYCVQDTAVTRTLYLRLTERMRQRGFSEFSCWLEHQTRVLIDEQQRAGFYFDIQGGESLRDLLRMRQRELEDQIRKIFPPVLQPVKTYQRRKTTTGLDFASYHRHVSEYPEVRHNDDGTYTVYDWKTFNIASPQQRVEKLLSLGWKPTQFTPKTEKGGGGNPKVDEDSLLEFAEKSGIKEVAAIAEWLVLQGRASMIETWLKNVNRTDSCIHGWVNSCGAGTRRMTHNSPNTANIPKAEDGVPYGKEVRALWTARPGRYLVGADAKSCQARIFGHYLNNDEVARRYYDAETYGDPHQVHADAFGDSSKRSKAKNVFFAFIFGASAGKLALTWGTKKSEGKKIKDLLFDRNPGLKELMDEIQLQWKRTGGWLKCIDGGWVRCPAEHAALNYVIQSAEKIQMALAAYFLRRWIKEQDLDAFWVGNIHDEWQLDCVDEATAERVGELACEAMRTAGRYLGFRVPMDGDYRIGRNWKETH